MKTVGSVDELLGTESRESLQFLQYRSVPHLSGAILRMCVRSSGRVTVPNDLVTKLEHIIYKPT